MNLATIPRQFFRSELVRGSVLLLAGFTTLNALNYVFQLIMGRMLGPIDYGTMAALLSVFIVFGVPASTMSTIVTKFTCDYKAKDNFTSVFSLLAKMSKGLLWLGVAICAFFIFGGSLLASFLKIPTVLPIVLLGILFLYYFPAVINDAVLRGLLKFPFLSANSVLSGILKLGISVLLVYLGLNVAGVIVAILVSYLIPYLITFLPLRFLWRHKADGASLHWKEIVSYAIPAFSSNLGLMLMITMDVILVKHFFDPHQAGLYSALAVVGKIIVFISSPVTMVMFPLVAERYAKGGAYKRIFLQTLLIISASSLILIAIYFLFPESLLNLFFGAEYLPAAPYLGWFGIFIFLYALCTVISQFFLSIEKTGIIYLTLLAAVMQIVLITLYHSSFTQVITISTAVTLLLFLGLLVYFLKQTRDETKSTASVYN